MQPLAVALLEGLRYLVVRWLLTAMTVGALFVMVPNVGVIVLMLTLAWYFASPRARADTLIPVLTGITGGMIALALR